MPRKQDLIDRAAKCELASLKVTDPHQQAALRSLRDLWTNLADESPSMTDVQLAKEIAALERIHATAFGLGEDKAAE